MLVLISALVSQMAFYLVICWVIDSFCRDGWTSNWVDVLIFFSQHFQVRIHLELTACEEQLLLKGGYGPWRPCCEELLCYQFRTGEAMLRPVEAWGGIPIHFGGFSYVKFLHLYRLSFSPLTFTDFFSFLFSLFFSFLSFYSYICTLLDRFLHELVWIFFQHLPTQLFVLFRSQCVWNGPAWGPATVRVADSGLWKPLLRPVGSCGGMSSSTLDSNTT